MPKERLHLLLADQSIQILASSAVLPAFDEVQNFAYFLGAISPDILFYNLPSFRYSSEGNALHQLEGQRCLAFLEGVVKERSTELTPEMAAWFLGMASHLLADGYWHPLVERLSDPDSALCTKFELSRRQCHYWLESELEGYWLARTGPQDGYLPLIRQFMRMDGVRASCIKALRMILMRMDLDRIPSESEIRRCLFWQTTLIRQFSSPVWARQRNLLLKIGATRLAGSLIVPLNADSSHLASAKSCHNEELENLFSDEFLTHSLTFLSTHLRSLAEQVRHLLQ